jgi:hypothetical protein
MSEPYVVLPVTPATTSAASVVTSSVTVMPPCSAQTLQVQNLQRTHAPRGQEVRRGARADVRPPEFGGVSIGT